jgi:hypothetical protein
VVVQLAEGGHPQNHQAQARVTVSFPSVLDNQPDTRASYVSRLMICPGGRPLAVRPLLDVRADCSDPANQPVRWLAEGRDPSATIDSANCGFGKNDGDDEITGAHVSNGDPAPGGILGAENPHLGDGRWRWFYTQQHGENPTYEVHLRSWGIG